MADNDNADTLKLAAELERRGTYEAITAERDALQVVCEEQRREIERLKTLDVFKVLKQLYAICRSVALEKASKGIWNEGLAKGIYDAERILKARSMLP